MVFAAVFESELCGSMSRASEVLDVAKASHVNFGVSVQTVRFLDLLESLYLNNFIRGIWRPEFMVWDL
jgi:hypothetical protein